MTTLDGLLAGIVTDSLRQCLEVVQMNTETTCRTMIPHERKTGNVFAFSAGVLITASRRTVALRYATGPWREAPTMTTDFASSQM